MRSVIAVVIGLALCAAVSDALTFGVVGDWGMGGYPVGWFPEIRSVLQFNEQCAFLKCNFTLSVGDNIYCGDVGDCLQKSFVQGFTEGNTFFPSVGNHDNVGPQIGYSQRNPRWKFPSHYYSVKLPIDSTGYTVQIFAVDTTDGSLGGGGQLGWLERELAKSDARWKIIFGHYPTTGSGRHKRVGTVGRLHDIMHKYNVQAYFCGHDHIVEMSNHYGRVLGLSGGISRGGMMNRGIGGGSRRFTLTSPGEYNEFKTDWPTHGFMTVDLSPNVMNVNLFEANGGMYYDMSVTWDWMQSRVGQAAASQQHEWPSPEVVLAAFKDEATLPLGPGGGVVFRADGTAGPSSIAPASERKGTNNETVAPATPAPTATPSPQETPAPALTLPPDAVTQQPQDTTKQTVPSHVMYAVSSECVECGNEPTVGVPFTVAIQGVSVSTLCRIFLTRSALGCDVREKPDILSGTDVLTPSSNTITFTVTGVATTVYVCFSMDKGQTYARLRHFGSFFEEHGFTLLPPLGFTTAAPTQPPTTTAAPAVTSPRSPTAAKDTAGDAGHSTLTLAAVAFMCVAAGIIGAKFVGSQSH